jgi:hypothetical protein
MKIASYNKEFADKRHIDQDAAREWHKADKEMEKKDKDFYKKLPEHAESFPKGTKAKPVKKRTSQRRKRDKTTNASMEGVISSIVDLFKSNKSIDDIPDSVNDSTIQKLSTDPKALEGMELRTGQIDVRGVNTHLHLKHWSNNWLSDVERNAKQIDDFYKKFIPARVAYASALEKIYKHCQTLKPNEAISYAKPLVTAQKEKLGRIEPPEFRNLALEQRPDGNGNILKLVSGGGGPDTMEALTEGIIRKITSIMSTLLRSYDYEEDDYGWNLDDTDDYRWWSQHFPDDDSDIAKLLNLFPCAGEWGEFAYEDALDKVIEHMYLGLKGLVMKSIK